MNSINLDQFLNQQVANGLAQSVDDAASKLALELEKRKIKKIFKDGQKEISNGNYEILNEQYISDYQKNLKNKYSA